MKLFFAIFFILLSINTYSQTIKGRVINSKNENGIPYAYIIYPEIFKGTITDSSGYFEIKSDLKFKNVLISSIGYKDTLLPVDQISQKPIRLVLNDYTLNEITIVGNKKVKQLIGCQKKNPKNLTITAGNGGYPVYFPKNQGAFVEMIGINIERISSTKTQLLLRVLEPDTTFKILGYDKLTSLYKIDNLKKGWNDIDLSGENIRFSGNGLIVYFYFMGMNKDEKATINCSSNESDYSWISSSDYRRDYPLVIKNTSYKPALRMRIIK